MRKIKNILFLGFKNKASFVFSEPLIINLLDNQENEKYVFNICLSPSLLMNFLTQNVFKSFSKFIKKDSFLVHILVPDFNDVLINIKNKKVILTFIKYFIFEYSLLLFSAITYLIIYRKLPLILLSSKIISTNKYNLLLLSGTGHISGHFLLSRILSNPKPKYQMIWLPHAPHHGSSNIEFPNVLKDLKCKVEFWLPLANQKLTSNNTNITTFLSGYPLFESNEIEKIRNVIKKEKVYSNNQNLIVLLRRTEGFGISALEYTYSFEQTIFLLENLSIFVRNCNFSQVTFCLHPSTNLSLIKSLIGRFKWPHFTLSYDYFLTFANKNSVVVGSYTSVLLHSALAGLPTICFEDHIMKRLSKDEHLLYKIYRNSPIIFCDLSFNSLQKAYKNIDMEYFSEFSIKDISKANNLSNPYYLVQLANNNFLKAVNRIKDLA